MLGEVIGGRLIFAEGKVHYDRRRRVLGAILIGAGDAYQSVVRLGRMTSWIPNCWR